MDYLEYICNCVVMNHKSREIIIYGYSDRNKVVKEALEAHGLYVSFFVDKSSSRQKNKDVYSPDILNKKSKYYYIVIAMINHQDIVSNLTSMGYSDSDYAYLGNLKYSVIRESDDYYEDNYGNKIFGQIDRTKIRLKGFNSIVTVHKGCIIGQDFFIDIRDNSTVEIGQDCKLNCRLVIFDNSIFKCGNKCVFSPDGLFHMFDSKIIIGDDVSFEKHYTIRTLTSTSITIGNDCMISYNVNIRTDDGHSIFDIKSKQNINSTKEISESRKIYIGNHVWIGMNSLILYNSCIKNGSVIGAMSLVKSEIPNNCIAAGIPAKIIKKDIAWSRNNHSDDISECGVDYINLTCD